MICLKLSRIVSILNIDRSVGRAETRFRGGGRTSERRVRSDRGRFRLDPRIAGQLADRIDGYDKPSVNELLREMQRASQALGGRGPSRATIYSFIAKHPVPGYRVGRLPAYVRQTLFNLGPDSDVPGDQLVFRCLNYGDTDAISFAAGLPWRHLHCALRMRGWRPKSRALLDAIVRARTS
jgi:hypothetical protein